MSYAHDLPPATSTIPVDSVAKFFEYLLRESQAQDTDPRLLFDRAIEELSPEATARLTVALDEAIASIQYRNDENPVETILPINPENFTADDSGVIWGSIGSKDSLKVWLRDMLDEFGEDDFDYLLQEAMTDISADQLEDLRWTEDDAPHSQFFRTPWPDLDDNTYRMALYNLFGKFTESALSGARSRVQAFSETLATYDTVDLITAGRVIQDLSAPDSPDGEMLAFYPFDMSCAELSATGEIRVPLATTYSLARFMEDNLPDITSTPDYQEWWEKQTASYLSLEQSDNALAALAEFVESDLRTEHPFSV